MDPALSNYEDAKEELFDLSKSLLRYLVLGFVSSAIVHPFEVVITLRQIQFLPKGIKKNLSVDTSPSPRREAGSSDTDIRNRLELAQNYLLSSSRAANQDSNERLPTDSMGYIIPDPIICQTTLQESDSVFVQAVVLPSRISLDRCDGDSQILLENTVDTATNGQNVDLGQESTTSLMTVPLHEIHYTDLMHHFIKTQGFIPLWKGLWTGFVHQMSRTLLTWLIQSKFEGYLLRTFLPSHLSDNQCEAISTISSHLLISWALSPLEMLRTRLIAQSSLKVERKYKRGIFGNIATIAEEEGGIWEGLYARHSMLTLCYHACLPFVRQVPFYYIASKFTDSDTSFGHEGTIVGQVGGILLSWAFHALYLVVSIPLEACRKRIFVQPVFRNSSIRTKRAFPFITCVHLRPLYYDSGIISTIYKICTEEGFGTLYRGWTLRLGNGTISSFFMLAQKWTMVEDEEEIYHSIDTQ